VEPSTERRRFSRVQVLEATAASLMAAAILATAGGMGWLVVSLPNRLQQMETQITQMLRNQDLFGAQFQELQKQVNDLDRRTIRLELNR
jgi:septal ring factor EnvC (AmiA/AmiB activator)